VGDLGDEKDVEASIAPTGVRYRSQSQGVQLKAGKHVSTMTTYSAVNSNTQDHKSMLLD
jgi:hypothetical protein